MTKLLEALFPQGHRKLMMSLIALVVGVVMEKFGGGLSDNMQTSLIAIVAIFAGGNVGEHIANALKFLKGTKVGQIVEDIVPGDQGLGVASAVAPAAQPARAPAVSSADLEDVLGEVDGRFADLEKKLAVQAQNVGQIVNILNQMRGAQGGQAPKPPGTA